MHTNDLLADYSTQRHTVERHLERLIHDRRVALSALQIEAVLHVDRAGFVVAAQQEHTIRVEDGEGEEQGDDFQGERTTVDVVAKEQVSGDISDNQ